MANLASRPQKVEDQFQRLLQEQLAGDADAVRQVQALIQQLRAARVARDWEVAPPEHCAHGRIPHC